MLEKYQINIWMYSYSQTQGISSKKDGERRDRSGTCPLDWRIIKHSNVDRLFFQQSWHIWIYWKIARTTFECLVVLQSRGQILSLLKLNEARISEWNIYWMHTGNSYSKFYSKSIKEFISWIYMLNGYSKCT